MKRHSCLFVFISGCLLLGACTRTTIYRANGRPAFTTTSDILAARFEERPDGTIRFTADKIDNATPTKAYGEAAGARLRELGVIATAASKL